MTIDDLFKLNSSLYQNTQTPVYPTPNGLPMSVIPTKTPTYPTPTGAPIPTYPTPNGLPVTTKPTKPTTTTTAPKTTISGTKPTVTPAGYNDVRDASGQLVNPPGALYDRNTGLPLTNVSNTPTAPVPGSAEYLARGTGYTYTQNPDEVAAEALRKQINEYNQSLFNVNLDPNEIYKNKLSEYQAQIDAINNIYNDQLSRARLEGQGRLESRKFSQGRSGQIGSGTGEAGINAVQDANTQVEQAIQNERAAAISAIMGKVRNSAAEDLAAKTKAKKEGADAILAELAAAPERKKKRVNSVISELISRGIDINDMTEEEINSLVSGLGVSKDSLLSAYQSEYSSVLAAQEKAALDKAKTESEIAYKEAQTQKELFDINNWGKMTEYQKAQLAIDQYKAYNPTGRDSDKKANALGKIASELTPGTALPDGKTYVIDANGYITPEGYNYMVQNAPQVGVSKEDILKTFGQLLYKDKKTGYSAYRLTGADEKLLTAITPTE